jgi:hypothetical protein
MALREVGVPDVQVLWQQEARRRILAPDFLRVASQPLTTQQQLSNSAT